MARQPKAKSAKRTKAKGSPALGEAIEGFFRPFTKLKATKSQGKDQGKSAAQKTPESAAQKTPAAAKTPAAPKKNPKPQAAKQPDADGPPNELVDPDTFAIYMAGVRALEDKPSRIPRTASRLEKVPASAEPKADPDAPARAQLRSLVTEGLRFETIDDGERLEGRRITVDPREIRKLRKGMYAVDGKLDLHGMTLEEAREAVTTFVKRRQSEGDRVIALIPGRGSHSPRGIGVLRGELGAWLSDGRAARHVAAFATAPDDMGGAGVLLVLLAR
ncbi:MAG TPA: Smr/MutS family protein, partial [Polyangiaceae bacterium]|nr:Smr/MutS family protein [Polyangiaceae bacterium]